MEFKSSTLKIQVFFEKQTSGMKHPSQASSVIVSNCVQLYKQNVPWYIVIACFKNRTSLKNPAFLVIIIRFWKKKGNLNFNCNLFVLWFILHWLKWKKKALCMFGKRTICGWNIFNIKKIIYVNVYSRLPYLI